MEIIGISGKIGSGKNFFAEKILKNMLPDKPTLVLALADHFKIEAIVKDNLDRNKVFGRKDEKTRIALQKRGTEEGRNKYGINIWVDILTEWIKIYNERGIERFIITDVRFMNEVEAIRNLGGTLIRIEAPKRSYQTCLKEGNSDEQVKLILNHSSENGFNDSKLEDIFDFIIYNEEEDNISKQAREFVLKYQEKLPKHKATLFVDLDDTLCICNDNYQDVFDEYFTIVDDFLENWLKQDGLSYTSKEIERFKREHILKFYNIAEEEREQPLYDRDSLKKTLKRSFDWVIERFKINSYELIDITVNKLQEIAHLIHYKDFNEIDDSILYLKKLLEGNYYNVVIYTIGEKVDQLRKVYELGLFDFNVEVVRRKDKTILLSLMEKYKSEKYYLVGDSYKNDIVPTFDLNFEKVFFIKSDNHSDRIINYGKSLESNKNNQKNYNVVNNFKNAYSQLVC